MPRAICEDCGSLVDADLTHNGVCTVGHYVHCGWGHQLSPDELISDDVAEIIAKLEAKLAENEVRLGKAVEALTNIDALDPENLVVGCSQDALSGLVNRMGDIARTTLAEIKGDTHE